MYVVRVGLPAVDPVERLLFLLSARYDVRHCRERIRVARIEPHVMTTCAIPSTTTCVVVWLRCMNAASWSSSERWALQQAVYQGRAQEQQREHGGEEDWIDRAERWVVGITK